MAFFLFQGSWPSPATALITSPATFDAASPPDCDSAPSIWSPMPRIWPSKLVT
ncbi:Uncharacterised protein [Mycobacteroides abscessus subsp. abscessus]|nr:Uncharacterised protein [Mycobacteroides abscessus subsp. abscessus]